MNCLRSSPLSFFSPACLLQAAIFSCCAAWAGECFFSSACTAASGSARQAAINMCFIIDLSSMSSTSPATP